MKLNLFEKIVLNHCSKSTINVGDIVEADIDRVMIHDFFAPFVIDKFKEIGFKKVFDPDKIVFVYDHLVPTSFVDDYHHHKTTEEFVAEFGIKHVHRSDGVCHQLMVEQGYSKPGDIVLGTDSHTVTYGAVGAVATGVGYTEMATTLGAGKMWLKVVPSIKVHVTGELMKGVTSKDIILRIIDELRCDGATYKVLEFSGSTIDSLSIDSRMTLANMSVEAGAKAGIMAADHKTLGYLSRHFPAADIEMLQSDEGAEYESTINIDVSDLEPLVACPYNVDNVKKASKCGDIEIDQAFLGSCTNGRLEDLAVAANILEGKKVKKNVRFMVVPASREVFLAATNAGYIETLAKAGAVVGHPACSLCCGRSGGLLTDGEKIISSNNRNFYGRMGGNKVEIFLGSSATVAASALEGRITDGRKYLKK